MSATEKIIDVSKHAILRTVSVLCVLLVVAGIYYAVYRTFIKPPKTESYAQQATTINNTEHNFYPNKKIFGLGITLWGFDIGITKLDYPKEKEKK